MTLIRYILILSLGLVITSFKITGPLSSDKLSVIVINVKYKSFGIVGYGGELKIRNIETNELFESHSKKGLNPIVIIEKVPAGTYVVEEIKIISGPNILTIKDKTLFNTLDLNSPKIYYLGSYLAKKIPPILELNFQIIKTENDGSEKIYKELKKKSDEWLKLNIDFDMRLFKSDNTNFEIKNNH
jgi:hypothetical protein